MNSQIQAKIDMLTKQLDEKKAKAISASRIAAIVYGVLVIFVFGYTMWLHNAIREQATSENISALLRGKVSDTIPLLHQKVIEFAEQQSPVIIEDMIMKVHDYAPQLENSAKETIDKYIDVLVNQTKEQIMPEFIDTLKAHSKEISEAARALSEENTAQELVKMLINEMDQKINYEVITDEFFGKFHELRSTLDKIADTPDSKLTRKELSEKNAIVNWMYLMKNGESLQSVLQMFIRDIAYTLESLKDGSLFIDRPSSLVPEGEN